MQGMRPYSDDRRAGIRGIQQVKRTPDAAMPELLMIDVVESENVTSRLFVAGNLDAQAALKIEAARAVQKLPAAWDGMTESPSEAIISLATGQDVRQVLYRFANTVEETLELGPVTPLIKLYRASDLIVPLIRDFIKVHNKPRAIAWVGRRHYKELQKAHRMNPDRLEKRKGQRVFIWDNEDY